LHPFLDDVPSAVVRSLGRNFAIDRELGKLPRTAPDRLILQLRGQVDGPWVSVGDRCRPMPRHVRGTAGRTM
jgi:hypothetical protein